MAIAVQMAVTASMTQTGRRIFPWASPKKVFFIRVMPWVRGNRLTSFCMAWGITSTGRVVPEKISMGKYKTDAITLACLEFLAIPPRLCRGSERKQLLSSLYPPDCPQLDIAPFAPGFQLDAGVFVVPAIAGGGGIILLHGVAHRQNGFAVVLLREGLTLEE